MAHRVSLSLQDDGAIYINGGMTLTEDGLRFPIRQFFYPDEIKMGTTYDDLLKIMLEFGCAVLDEHGIHPPMPEDLL